MLSLAFPHSLLRPAPLDALFEPHQPLALAPDLFAALQPRGVELAEADHQYTVTLATPGLGAEDVKLSCEDGVLHLTGEKHADGRFTRVQRRVRLPRDADLEAISASCEHGVLHLTVPKKQRAEPLSLAVATAAEQPDSDDYHLAIAAPGIAPRDLRVIVHEGEVKIDGKSTSHGGEYSISRRVQLPRDADPAAAAVSLVNGIITLTVPKSVLPPAKQLRVASAPAEQEPSPVATQDPTKEPASASAE